MTSTQVRSRKDPVEQEVPNRAWSRHGGVVVSKSRVESRLMTNYRLQGKSDNEQVVESLHFCVLKNTRNLGEIFPFLPPVSSLSPQPHHFRNGSSPRETGFLSSRLSVNTDHKDGSLSVHVARMSVVTLTTRVLTTGHPTAGLDPYGSPVPIRPPSDDCQCEVTDRE